MHYSVTSLKSSAYWRVAPKKGGAYFIVNIDTHIKL